MTLKILTVVCLVILLVVGFCFAGVVNGGSGVQDEVPFTVTDCTTGEVLLEDGYRRQYSADLKKERTFYYEGPV